jgi:hypothetical protein
LLHNRLPTTAKTLLVAAVDQWLIAGLLPWWLRRQSGFN